VACYALPTSHRGVIPHEIVNLPRFGKPATKLVTVDGPICETGDRLGSVRQLPPPKENDVLLIANAVAYGYAMSSRYNLQRAGDRSSHLARSVATRRSIGARVRARGVRVTHSGSRFCAWSGDRHALCRTSIDPSDSFCRAAVREGSDKRLRTFCVVARRLSFKAAADELCVTPSAVSHQIKALEQCLQTKLFLRRANAIALTDFGADLLARVDPLLVELDDVIARFKRSARAAASASRARAYVEPKA
jgi:hypothetical protein